MKFLRPKNCRQNFITLFTLKPPIRNDICHLVLTLGASSRNIPLLISVASIPFASPTARGPASSGRERKMRTNFFCTNFLNTRSLPGHPGKIPGTSQIPLFETQGRQSFEGEHEVFDHHPFPWKTPTPPGGLQTEKVSLCALLSGTKKRGFLEGGFCKMYASLGCGALSAKCIAGANILGYFLFPWP